MEAELPQDSSAGHHGLGSWHPARRPETQNPPSAKGKDVQDDKDSFRHHNGDYSTEVGLDSKENTFRVASHLPSPPDSATMGDNVPNRPTASFQPMKVDQVYPNGLGIDATSERPSADAVQRLVDDPSSHQQHGQGVYGDVASDNGSLDEHTHGRKSATTYDFSHPDEEAPLDVDLEHENHVDPAWGLEPEAFDIGVHRRLNYTNSFPDVPPIQEYSNPPQVHSLPHSQVEDIMEEITEVEAEDGQAVNGLDFESGFEGNREGNDPFKQNLTDKEDYFSRGMTEIAQEATPLDEEVRFEEGLPLIAPGDDETAVQQTKQSPTDDLLTTEDQPREADAEDFFGNVPSNSGNDAEPFNPIKLDRKSTTQVLSSIQYPPRSEVHKSMAEDANPSFEDKIGEGIPVSMSTVLTQVLREDAKEGRLGRDEAPGDLLVSKDDDLAAMWQAALADDDFLEDESSVDPTSFFDGGEEEFLNEPETLDSFHTQTFPPIPRPVISPNGLVEGFSGASTREVPQASAGSPIQSRYTPQPGQTEYSSGVRPNSAMQSSYAPTGFQNAFHTPSDITGGFRQQPSYLNHAQIQRPSLPEKIQSFADKSKGGYTSPYDLPMEVNRPRKRIGLQQFQNSNNRTAINVPPPPPRSSSVTSSAMSPYGQYAHQASPTMNNAPNMSPSLIGQMPSPTDPNVARIQPKASGSSFFEELPVVSKHRPSSSAGKFVPPAYQSPPSQMPVQRGSVDQTSYPSQPHPTFPTTSQPYQLLPPERIMPFAPSNAPAPATQQLPTLTARYSPSPQAQPGVPPNQNRYATRPVGPHRPPSVSQVFPHQPRTSSPLARSMSAQNQYLPRAQSQDLGLLNDGFPTGSRRPSLRTTQTAFPTSTAADTYQNASQYSQFASAPVLSDGNPGNQASSYSHPLQETQLMSPDNRTFDRPQRSEAQFSGPVPLQPGASNLNGSQHQRRSSIDDQISPKNIGSQAAQQSSSLNERLEARRSSLAGPNFIIPSDGSEHDPLERWKGCPVFNFGFGGHVVTSFPQRTSRYAAGQLVPMIKCSPGEVHIRTGRIIPLDQHVADFPGPLKSKGKKKEVAAWLERGIERLVNQQSQFVSTQARTDLLKRYEECILLWRVLHVLVEYDGVIDGNPAATQSIRAILSPQFRSNGFMDQASYEATTRSRSMSKPGVLPTSSNSTNSEAVGVLFGFLLEGEREKAVWHAVDRQMWGHAMLLASTLPRDVWRQVTQEFIRSDVKPLGDNAESLSALYDIVTGSWEESVDKLVPPSARAGLQMVSKSAGSGPTKNALDGLDQWRNTLSLILSNRSADDSKALLALGRLLANYGRIEAAHICFIFSKAPGLFGGPDDPQASVTLLGADHINQPFDYGRDLDSVLLTEVYEYAVGVLAASTIPTIAPHLQAHKLHHAMVLAEYGYRDEAQQYCDAIMNILKATTKLSPYYHAQMFGSLDDLTSRLRQAPKDGSTSWIARPSMDKVSGSIWNRLNQFVTGDDSDTGSTGSGKGESEAGPFAKIAGDTPSISRAQSPDLYGSYANGGNYNQNLPMLSQPPANSRYAPGGQYAPRASLDQPPPPILDSQRLGHLDALKRADLQRQSSSSSLPTLSPDLYMNQQNVSHQQAQRPSSATFVAENEINLHPSSTQSSYSPEFTNHNRTDPHQSNQFSRPSYHTNDSTLSINHQPITAVHSPPSRSPNQLSPYGPRSGLYKPLRSPASGGQLFATYEARSPSFQPRSYQPSPVSDKPLPHPPQLPPSSDEAQPSYEPYAPSYEPPSYQPTSAPPEITPAALEPPSPYGYQPPSSSYDPPSYDPETQSGDLSPVQDNGKRRTYLDEDEDDGITVKGAALKKAEKAKKDREAEEAFRKAAEADGTSPLSKSPNPPTNNPPAQKDARPSAQAPKSSWFSSWIPGTKAKDPSSSSSTASRGPIKARLGEESSFVYDDTLKKWVNKRAGPEAATASAPTPPPPKGPPSRAASAAGGPPPPNKPLPTAMAAALGGQLSPGSAPSSQAPSRNPSPSIGTAHSPLSPHAPSSDARSTPPVGALSEPAAPGGLAPASGVRPPSAPPSRPATGMSGASSIDELIGAPAARKGGTVKGKKKGRGYVDVMAK
ncbi:vesicle coat component [Lambiella insularis]|nr:vesicle coat component [Lambiella insularis]